MPIICTCISFAPASLVTSGKVASAGTSYNNSGDLGTENNTTAGISSLSFENFVDIFTPEKCSLWLQKCTRPIVL